MARIVEIVPRVELRSVPHAPVFLAGLLGYRGHVVPVIDLCLLLDVAPCRDCLSTRIILVSVAPNDPNQSKPDRGESGEGRRLTPDQKQPTNLLGLIAEHVSDLTYRAARAGNARSSIPAPGSLPGCRRSDRSGNRSIDRG